MPTLEELEAELLELGQAERRSLESIALLKLSCRSLGQAGRYEEADVLYSYILSTEAALAQIKTRILAIERQIYPARLRSS